MGRFLVAFKKLLRPFVQTPQNDLWERQRVFNLILLEKLRHQEELLADHRQRLDRIRELRFEERVRHLEDARTRGVKDLMAHTDALFARVDQKLDLHRREVRDLQASLGEALALVASEAGPSDDTVRTLDRAREEHGYLQLEQRYRGTEEEIRERIARYLPLLEGAPGPVLDLGCGRGEALALLADAGVEARGVDASARMVAHCAERGLSAREGDLFEVLAAQDEGSLGGVVSFHVIEHLPAAELDRLVRLAHRALAAGGVLILETPNPLSLIAGSRNFWLDPTHRRPVHPESLSLLYELAGFEQVETVELRPFPDRDRPPEIDLATLPEDLHRLAHDVNRLRDHLDRVLYGYQDFAVVGRKVDGAQ